MAKHNVYGMIQQCRSKVTAYILPTFSGQHRIIYNNYSFVCIYTHNPYLHTLEILIFRGASNDCSEMTLQLTLHLKFFMQAYYVVSSLWTPEHYTHMWAYLECCQNIRRTIVYFL